MSTGLYLHDAISRTSNFTAHLLSQVGLGHHMRHILVLLNGAASPKLDSHLPQRVGFRGLLQGDDAREQQEGALQHLSDASAARSDE